VHAGNVHFAWVNDSGFAAGGHLDGVNETMRGDNNICEYLKCSR
jgi:hypothetical protein